MAPVAASPTPIAAPLPLDFPAIAAKDKKAAARKRLETVYAIVRDDLLADLRRRNMPVESIEYYRRVRTSLHPLYFFSLSYPSVSTTARQCMDYNVPGGKLNRGLSVVDSVAILKGRELTESEYFRRLPSSVGPSNGSVSPFPTTSSPARPNRDLLKLQAYLLVTDDIMDASTIRRGQPCWYHVEGVVLKAVNDAFILEGAIFQMIRKNFRNEPFYVNLVDFMHEAR
jgi:farnesyl diphosphate synthase